ncbi:hypothetical protein ABFA07_011220 [Porites harrisoni]
MADLFKISLFILLAVTFTHVTCRDIWKRDDVFTEIDIDPVDGQVSTHELTEYLEQTSDEKDVDFGVLAASYVSAADTDGNGYLNRNEFHKSLPFDMGHSTENTE